MKKSIVALLMLLSFLLFIDQPKAVSYTICSYEIQYRVDGYKTDTKTHYTINYSNDEKKFTFCVQVLNYKKTLEKRCFSPTKEQITGFNNKLTGYKHDFGFYRLMDKDYKESARCNSSYEECSSIFNALLEDFTCPKSMVASVPLSDHMNEDLNTPYLAYVGGNNATNSNGAYPLFGHDYSTVKKGDKTTFTYRKNDSFSFKAVGVTFDHYKKVFDFKKDITKPALAESYNTFFVKNPEFGEGKICDLIKDKDFDAKELVDGKIGKAYKRSVIEKMNEKLGGNWLGTTDADLALIPEPLVEGLTDYVAKTSAKAREYIEKCKENAESDEERQMYEEADAEIKAETAIFVAHETSLSDYWEFDWNGPDGCEGFLGDPETPGNPAHYLKLAFKIIKYAAVVLTIVLSTVDFIKAVTAQDKDALNKAVMNSIKRLILAVAIFFLPVLINFILNLIGAYSTCGVA